MGGAFGGAHSSGRIIWVEVSFECKEGKVQACLFGTVSSCSSQAIRLGEKKGEKKEISVMGFGFLR